MSTFLCFWYQFFYNNIYCVDALLQSGCDPNVQGVAIKPYVIAASKHYDSIAIRLVDFRPESFEKMNSDVPTLLYEPAMDLDLTIFDEEEQRKQIEKQNKDLLPKKGTTHARRSDSTGVIPRVTRRMTLGPKSAPKNFL